MKFTQFALAAALLATASAQGLDALPDCAVCLSFSSAALYRLTRSQKLGPRLTIDANVEILRY